MLVSATTIARNVVTLQYPVDRVIRGTVGFADEFIISVDPSSEDDSLRFIHTLANNINDELGVEFVRVFESVWDVANMKEGSEFAIQTNKTFDWAKGDFIFYVQLDECLHEKDFAFLKEEIKNADYNNVDAFSMVRLYFYESVDMVREDWSVPIVRLFRSGTRRSCGDAMNSEGSTRVKELPCFIYHYSRVGVDPKVMSNRILSLDKFFHQPDKLLSTSELKPYDFEPRNFDCMHKNEVDLGRKKVSGQFSVYLDSHPKAFCGYGE